MRKIVFGEKIDLRKAQNDTTTFSVEGSYENQEEGFDLEHYDTQQRWIVFYSQQAHDRAKKL